MKDDYNHIIDISIFEKFDQNEILSWFISQINLNVKKHFFSQMRKDKKTQIMRFFSFRVGLFLKSTKKKK